MFKLIIETNHYAGNFEREMTAYCTGHVGECGVGKEHAAIFREEVPQDPFGDSIVPVPDDHGCARPCKCDGNNVIIFFEGRPTPEQIAIIKERASKFHAVNAGMSKWRNYLIGISKLRVVEEVTQDVSDEEV